MTELKEITQLPESEETEVLPWWQHHPVKKVLIYDHDYVDQSATFTLKFSKDAKLLFRIEHASVRDPSGDTGAREWVEVKFDDQVMVAPNQQWAPGVERYEVVELVPNNESGTPYPLSARTPLRVSIVHGNARAKAVKLRVMIWQLA